MEMEVAFLPVKMRCFAEMKVIALVSGKYQTIKFKRSQSHFKLVTIAKTHSKSFLEGLL